MVFIDEGDGTLQKRMDAGRCPRCDTSLQPVEVHGHVQCAVCKLYINECCQGETAEECSNVFQQTKTT